MSEHRQRMLMAEDDADIRHLNTEEFGNAGYFVYAANMGLHGVVAS